MHKNKVRHTGKPEASKVLLNDNRKVCSIHFGCQALREREKKNVCRFLCLHINSFFQGYLFISVLVNTNSDLIKLIVQSIKNDLGYRNPVHVNLALQCIANIGSKEMADAFGTDIPKLLVSG